MATDKSLNIRQVKAAEQTAGAIAEMRRRFDELETRLADTGQILADLVTGQGKLDAQRAADKAAASEDAAGVLAALRAELAEIKLLLAQPAAAGKATKK
jgi:hypothetical protein